MSLTADAMLFLASKGLSVQDIAEFLRLNETISVESKDDRRRRMDRERKRAAKPEIPQNSAENAESIASDHSANSTEIPQNSTENMTPLARVRDNITNSVDRPNLTTLHSTNERTVSGDDVEWPPESPPDRRYLDHLEGLLRHVGGKALNQTAPNLMILAPILALGATGNGPICDLYADILPTIAARCAKARQGSISQWGYFTEAIREARDRRLAGAPATQEIRHERPDAQTAKFDRKQRNLAVAGSVRPAQRGAFIG